MEQEFSDFKESDKSLMLELEPVKYSVSRMCLAGTVVAPLFLTQVVAGLKPFCCSDKYFVAKFYENI